MKVIVLQENLSRGLGIVGRAVPARTTLPITQNVLLATEGSMLKLAATNLEIAITCWIGAKVEKEGSLTIPARLLSEFVATLPNDKVELTLQPKGTTIDLSCGRQSARINGLDAADFPPIPTVGEGASVSLDPEALRLAIGQVTFAAATEDSRPVLTGVYTEFEGDRLTFAAADGFRLSVRKLDLEAGAPSREKTGVIIPARSLSELSRLLGMGDQRDPVQVTINAAKSQVLFKLKSAQLVSQLIQGTFPNYSQLIPQNYETKATAEVTELLRAAKTAAIFARDGSGIIRLQVTPGQGTAPGKIALSARAEEVGDNLGEVDAVVEGGAAKIAFNSKYLLDALAVIGTGQVALETTSPSSPGVIRPVGDDKYIHVVMPMFVQW
ncbi:MAG: DNA polymerase III subunit beta [Dehalococcoidia bacterium]|nr:DNA polymerase III subunit beta [Dehalococcoidia bacterium]